MIRNNDGDSFSNKKGTASFALSNNLQVIDMLLASDNVSEITWDCRSRKIYLYIYFFKCSDIEHNLLLLLKISLINNRYLKITPHNT